MTMPSPFQTRTGSLTEALCNVVSGFILAIVVQRLVYPLFDITTTLGDDAMIAFVFTAASLGRSYCIRRLFVAIERQRERERLERQGSLAQRLATGRPG
jgi:hypothetical protein